MTSVAELPDSIICHIISLASFTNKEAIQLSLLSRELFSALRNRPALIFDGGNKKELESLHETLARYYADGIPLDTFTFRKACEFMKLRDQCFTLASKLRPKHLDLHEFRCLKFPEPFFELESLVSLTLEGFSLKAQVSTVWPNLKRLCLVKVYMGLEDFEDIINGSPLIEDLAIIRCFRCRVDNLKVSNLRKLRQLSFDQLYSCQTFDVMDAPQLESITIKAWSIRFRLYQDIKAGLYRNLRTLSLDYVGCNEDFFANIGDQIPRLENLSVSNNAVLRRLVISSLSLKNIRLENIPRLFEARFDVPNVVLFEYFADDEQTNSIPGLSFSGNRQGWISRIRLRYIHSSIIAWWFHKLNEFLRSLKMSEISVTVKFRGITSEYENSQHYILGVRPRLHEFNVDCSSGFSSSSAAGVVDMIFSVCRPEKLTIPATFPTDKIDQRRISEIVDDQKNVTITFPEESFEEDLITSQEEIPAQRVSEMKRIFKFFGCLSPFS